jgi:hypothetical protein
VEAAAAAAAVAVVPCKRKRKKVKIQEFRYREIQRMWNLKCTIVPVIIGATGIVTKT